MKKVLCIVFLLLIACSFHTVAADNSYDYSFSGSAGYFGPTDSNYDGDFTINGSFEAKIS